MSEMTAVQYLKEKRRMLKSGTDFFNKSEVCKDCPFVATCEQYGNCDYFEMEHPEQAVSIVQKWSEEHPIKTMLMDFKEKHPNAPETFYGLPIICPDQLGYGARNPKECLSVTDERCVKCWNRPLESD